MRTMTNCAVIAAVRRSSSSPCPSRRGVGRLVACLVLAAVATARAQPDAGHADRPGPVPLDPRAATSADHAAVAIESQRLGPAPTQSPRDASSILPSSAPASTRHQLFSTLVALASVLGLILLAAAAGRRLARRSAGLAAALGPAGRAPAGLLEVLGRYPVARGQSLVLLRLDRVILLLAHAHGSRLAAGGAFTPLAQISDPEQVASILVKAGDEAGLSVNQRFHSLLAAAERDEPLHAGPAAAANDHTSRWQTALAGLRRLLTSPPGDRAELWPDSPSSIPVVDLTRRPRSGPGRQRARTVPRPTPSGSSPRMTSALTDRTS